MRILIVVYLLGQGTEQMKPTRNDRGDDQQNRRRERGHEAELGHDSQVVHAVFPWLFQRMPAADEKTQRPM
jgi:hypothetical protein